MKITAMFSLSLANVLRNKKSNVIIAILMVVTASIVIFSISVSSTLNDDIKRNVYNNIDGRTVLVSSKTIGVNESEVLKKLSSKKHIVAVTNQQDSCFPLKLDKKYKNVDGEITLLGANSKSSPQVSFGSNLKDTDENTAIIPSNFLPDSKCADIKGNCKYYDGKSMIGKTLDLAYKGKTYTLNVIGSYDSENCGRNSNDIYVPYSFIKVLNKADDKPSDDDVSQAVFAVVDESKNIECVINDLTNDGFEASRRININTKFSDFITFVGFILSAISIILSFFSILIFTLNSINRRTAEVGLMKATGYTNFNISVLLNTETLAVGIFSFFVSAMFASATILIINLTLNSGVGSTKIMVNLEAYLVALVISILTPLIGTFAASIRSMKISPAFALKDW